MRSSSTLDTGEAAARNHRSAHPLRQGLTGEPPAVWETVARAHGTCQCCEMLEVHSLYPAVSGFVVAPLCWVGNAASSLALGDTSTKFRVSTSQVLRIACGDNLIRKTA